MFTISGTQSKEVNTTTSSNPATLQLTPTVTAGTLAGIFYDVQANCTNVSPGPPAGSYIKGNQALSVIVGSQTYPNIRGNSIDMEATDVTVTCTQNCH
jgi:gentisate 1,2-dioxygenase